MLCYDDFKVFIESKREIKKKDYELLVKKYGLDTVSDLFEKYLDDSTVVDDDFKFMRASYYLEERFKNENFFDDDSSIYFKSNDESTGNLDILKLYLRDLNSYTTLTEQEQSDIVEQISALNKYMTRNNISIENINSELLKIGYDEKLIKNNSTSDLNKKLKYISNFFKDNITSDNLKIKSDLLYYIEYKKLYDKLIEGNLRLVIYCAKKFQNCGVELIDLIQFGNVGLQDAIEKYDKNFGAKFSTYSIWWINMRIKRGIANTGRLIRIPVNFGYLVNKYNNIINILGYELDIDSFFEYMKDDVKKILEFDGICDPSDDRIYSYCKSILERIQIVNKQNVISLSLKLGDLDDDNDIESCVKDENVNVEDEALKSMNALYIQDMLSSLPVRKKLTLVLYYGLKLDEYVTLDEFSSCISNDYCIINNITVDDLYNKINSSLNKYTYAQIGSMFNLTTERARQISAGSIKKLQKNYLNSKYSSLVD